MRFVFALLMLAFLPVEAQATFGGDPKDYYFLSRVPNLADTAPDGSNKWKGIAGFLPRS
jgi:hypothetical protein